MGAVVMLVLTFILNLAITLLPLSPFASLALDPNVEMITTGLGWLNWFIDIQGMWNLFSAVLALSLIYTVFLTILDYLGYFADKVVP